MSEQKVYRAIGLMSGTSLDGEIDIALIETDGQNHVKPLGFYAHAYDPQHKETIRACFGRNKRDETVEALVTDLHIEAVKASGFEADIIGFHGQTVFHDPDAGVTLQLGDGARMAAETGMNVVNDFRSADVAAGGQGAPLAPLYHQAIMSAQEQPLCVLNLGGVSNVTYIDDGPIIAFDCGPANALMDDYMNETLGVDYDVDGAFASAGQADIDVVTGFLANDYFTKLPPKSLDRDTFASLIAALPSDPQDAMATLSACSVQGVVQSQQHFPQRPKAWYICGGGLHNKHLMKQLSEALAPGVVQSIEQAGHNGDALEAECFAYLAVRSLLGLPISIPETTGVKEPLTGGVLHRA
ncbi:MAG: anhydro-N-acetylmuramic acid kinase [Pseudomonadota bacterium]